jgi:hypothetical protein
MINKFSYFRIRPLIASVKIPAFPIKWIHQEELDAQMDRKVHGCQDTYYIGGFMTTVVDVDRYDQSDTLIETDTWI